MKLPSGRRAIRGPLCSSLPPIARASRPSGRPSAPKRRKKTSTATSWGSVGSSGSTAWVQAATKLPSAAMATSGVSWWSVFLARGNRGAERAAVRGEAPAEDEIGVLRPASPDHDEAAVRGHGDRLPPDEGALVAGDQNLSAARLPRRIEEPRLERDRRLVVEPLAALPPDDHEAPIGRGGHVRDPLRPRGFLVDPDLTALQGLRLDIRGGEAEGEDEEKKGDAVSFHGRTSRSDLILHLRTCLDFCHGREIMRHAQSRSGRLLACCLLVALLVQTSACTMVRFDKRSVYQYDHPFAVEDDAFRRSLSAFGNAMVEGNRAEILNNGDEIFPAMTSAIREAKATVNLESYIFKDDRAGKIIAEALMDAARRGVEVRVLVDGTGSKFAGPLLDRMRQAGVDAAHVPSHPALDPLQDRPADAPEDPGRRRHRQLHRRLLHRRLSGSGTPAIRRSGGT